MSSVRGLFNATLFKNISSLSENIKNLLKFKLVPVSQMSEEIIELKQDVKMDTKEVGISSDRASESKTNVTEENGEISKISKRAMRRLKRREKKSRQEQEESGRCDEFVEKKERRIKEALEKQQAFDFINEATFAETQYYFENGLRKVHPYYFDFVANAKGRWLGKKLMDVFSKEFQNYSEEKCRRLIETGSLTVLSKPVGVDYLIQNGDVIVNRVHRHELPVAWVPIKVVADTDDLLVVDKPSSIPIHPCGRYRHNSLLYILAREHGYKNLRVLHRLDRLTSGLLMMGKNSEKTRELMEDIRNRMVKKEYLAKVDGVFPSGTIECNQPIGVLSQKLGIHKVDPHGKESSTSFKLVATDGKTSVVQCRPATGRTHQIRIHLQFLGFPISNDPIYNGYVWGPGKGKNGIYEKSDEQLIKDLADIHKASLYIDADNMPTPPTSTNDPGEIEEGPSPKRSKLSEQEPTDASSSTFDKDCPECWVKHVEPTLNQLHIYLHALSYEGQGWKFSTALPSWAEYE